MRIRLLVAFVDLDWLTADAYCFGYTFAHCYSLLAAKNRRKIGETLPRGNHQNSLDQVVLSNDSTITPAELFPKRSLEFAGGPQWVSADASGHG